MHRPTLIISANFMFFILFAQICAAPGDLDPTFGSGGWVRTSTTSRTLLGTCMAVQADGKIVTAGDTSGLFALARYNPDGTADVSFGEDGKVYIDFGGSITAIHIQPDGKIVALARQDFRVALARFNADGSLDSSFDADGTLTTDFGSEVVFPNDAADAFALQSDGKIVVAVNHRNASGSVNFGVVRYHADGSLDTSFDGDGLVVTSFGLNIPSKANAVLVQPDGKLLVGGEAANAITNKHDFAVARYNSDGTLDTGFDSDGKAIAFGDNSYSSIRALTQQADGKIVAAGSHDGTIISSFGIARFNTNGSLDMGFDSDGTKLVGFNTTANYTDSANAVSLDSTGRIVVAGLGFNYNFAIARLLVNGTLEIGRAHV